MTAVRVSALCLVLFGFATLPLACGSDSGKPTGNTKNDAGGGAGGAPAGTVACGEKRCSPSFDGTLPACCMDAFSSKCGVTRNGSCVTPPKPPPKDCPAIPVTGGMTYSACCTSTGLCGVDLSAFGAGCVDTVTAAMAAMAMGTQVGPVTATTCVPGDGGT